MHIILAELSTTLIVYCGVVVVIDDILNYSHYSSNAVAEGGVANTIHPLKSNRTLKRRTGYKLRPAGYQIVLSSSNSTPNIPTILLNDKVAFVLVKLILNHCESSRWFTVNLSLVNPLKHGLNVSCYSSILLAKWTKTDLSLLDKNAQNNTNARARYTFSSWYYRMTISRCLRVIYTSCRIKQVCVCIAGYWTAGYILIVPEVLSHAEKSKTSWITCTLFNKSCFADVIKGIENISMCRLSNHVSPLWLLSRKRRKTVRSLSYKRDGLILSKSRQFIQEATQNVEYGKYSLSKFMPFN